ncbi:Uncharacterized conserved protein YgbK, DUF1537 family [Oribacterium sp. KHPX15]|uniref:four-carbon acid sugar kinase family protein n=1 Tax=Oribacterium sp. KHPX15 TaxID=1855342 RepID=UPI00089604D6|nr:four-carbon acid sugar kinase family protein [Oribacterium sp. KHPX15]SEA24113.1 Uncharacterized conserved protein YgbK, DUF1537 family [Oribacterium sp. KHPX15]
MEQAVNRLLILADDLTGALDSGVQLTLKGEHVVILTDRDVEFPEDDSVDVIVVDTETRHVTGEVAANIIKALIHKAQDRGIKRIYKKTDSGLRGNVGAELAAVLEASGAKHLNFIPAYPATGRKTVNGVQYVNGKPLAESIFAKDPINPITVSRIDELIHFGSDVHVVSGSSSEKRGIVVYDAETNDDMKRIAQKLEAEGDLDITAGCAGFLEVFPVRKRITEKVKIQSFDHKLLILSGSVNDITRSQLDYAEKHGAYRVHVPMNRILKNLWSNHEKEHFIDMVEENAGDSNIIIIDTLGIYDPEYLVDPEEAAHTIAVNMGHLASCLLRKYPDRTVMIIGGDTLQGFIRNKGISILRPIKEIDPGIVIASYRYGDYETYLITKSGAFGSDDQLQRVLKWIESSSSE